MAPYRCVGSKTSPAPAPAVEEPVAPIEEVKPAETKPTPTNTPKPAITFSLFPLLPPEIRLQIWSYTLQDDFVMLEWNPTRRLFTSERKPPSLLSVNQEARSFGLDHCKLSFASSPEFARVYFDFERDILGVDWESLGPTPGRLGRKISQEELGKVACLSLNEISLLYHAKEDMRELSKFRGLEEIIVVCDEELQQQSGLMFGVDEMARFWEEMDGKGEERWPRLWCLNSHDDNWACSSCSSRHWWFAAWNQRTSCGQKTRWEETMSKCLRMTLFDTDG